MRKTRAIGVFVIVGSLVALGADWPTQGGNPQRNGWAKAEHVLARNNVGSLQVLYKYRADNAARSSNSLTPPIINGNLITYRGFKEMLIFGASSDKVFSVDADLNKTLWEARFKYEGAKPVTGVSTAACPGGLTSPVMMAGSSSSSVRFVARASRAPAAAGARPSRPSPYFPPLAESVYPLRPTTLTQLAAIYAVSSDGNLHVLNSSTGEDLIPTTKFLPANANVISLNLFDNVVYATTAGHCDGSADGLFAIDLLSKEKTVTSFIPRSGEFAGTGGTVIGNDGTVYVQAMYGPGDRAGHTRDTLIALAPKTLQVKDYFSPAGKPPGKEQMQAPGITPAVFSTMGRESILMGGKDGRLYLLDAKSLGGADHQTPLWRSARITHPRKKHVGDGFRGTFSSWHDLDSQTRWIYAPVSGPLDAKAGFPLRSGAPSDGSVIAFKLNEAMSPAALQPLWASRNLSSPSPVVIANGLVFALSTGEPLPFAKKNGKSPPGLGAPSQHAALFALDALSGKELYSSGTVIPDHSNPHGLAVANGRVYFSTQDNTVFCMGFMRTQPQLAEQ